MATEKLRAPGTPFSLSFSGSGFLALYQVGVVQSLLELAPELLKSACKVYGSSAGSLIAAAVVCGISLDDLKEVFYANAREARKTLLGPLSPKCSLLANIRDVLERRLPEDSYLVASGRLHISLTRVMDGQNVMVSEFSSNEELIQVLNDIFFQGYQDTALFLCRNSKCSPQTQRAAEKHNPTCGQPAALPFCVSQMPSV
ncbi:hypothetical protein CIB84_004098 [Bambusicola thoracicus]|uniref:PNPLA domain-containing protein n=1 Tax=Bambusicola thoracicus TaxID=9083 RepID=A0A2P4T715_BAMTH|nr:hypothetical protein CIB84_004098 [Bambusicola thoracicus]